MGISIEHNKEHNMNNTNEHGDHAALATQLERQVEKRIFFHQTGGLSDFMVNTGGLSNFFIIPGVYLIL